MGTLGWGGGGGGDEDHIGRAVHTVGGGGGSENWGHASLKIMTSYQEAIGRGRTGAIISPVKFGNDDVIYCFCRNTPKLA